MLILCFLLIVSLFVYIIARQKTIPTSNDLNLNILSDLKSTENAKIITVYKVMGDMRDGQKKVVTGEKDKLLINNAIKSAMENVNPYFNHDIQYREGGLLFEYQFLDGQTSMVRVYNKTKTEEGTEVVLLACGKEDYTVEWTTFSHLKPIYRAHQN